MSLHEIVRRYADGTISTTEALTELEKRLAIPLSEGQRGLWTLHQLEPDTYAYNVPVCFSCEHVDLAALEGAFRDTVARHPVLSGRVEETADGPCLVQADLEDLRIERAEVADVREGVTERARRPFDLTAGPLVRLSVLTCAPSETYVLLVIHHLVIDGVSARIVFDTLFRAYQARLAGRELPFRPNSPWFGDFVAWERDYLGSERAEADRAFWQRELAGRVPLTGLPTDATLPPDAPHEGEVHTSRLPREPVAALLADHELSPGMFFLAIFTTLLHRYTGQEDIVVGMPMSGRPLERFDPVVGYFVNTLPIRSRPVGSTEFTEFARQLRSTVFAAMEHGSYPFPRIVRDLGRGADLRSPIYQVVFNYQSSTLSGHLDDDTFRLVDDVCQVGEYDLTVDVVPGDEFVLHWKYHPGAFSAATIARMADHFATLVDGVVASGGRAPIGALPLLDEAERRLVLDEWNRTDVDYPEDRTCWDLFAERVAAHPDSPAVTCGEQTLTYRELADRAGGLAAALADQGAGEVVGVCVERSLDLVVGLLAVMRLGAAYVPLDADLPAERLSHMIRDSGARLVVCHAAVLPKLSTVDTGGATLYQVEHAPAHAEPARPRPSPGVAYVMYTSGSTGKPKGVVVPHRALTNFLLAMARTLGVTAEDRLLAVTTHSFDIAALELYLPLITGGHCRVSDSAADATLLAEEIAAWRPTLLQATPATWAMLLHVGWENPEGVRILCGGESMPEHLKDRLLARGEVWNLYGPTETTIWSTAKRLRPDEPVTIGTPIANTRVYVLDEHLRPVPIGIPGELCISGHGVALGYHGKPELTAERFADNPFARGERLYRTGDIARRLPSGEVVLLGRMDNQVKLRGYRIELGEIETALNGHPDVAHSVVVTEHDGQRLTAYLTAHRPVEPAALRAHLARTLPAYMVPSGYVTLDAFPLTANGKVDRARLRDTAPAAGERPAAATGIERTVRGIFATVLGTGDIDRDTGFFDAGGDSFTAIDVVTEINRAFGCRLRPTTLFAHPSVTAMARHLAGLLPAASPEPVAAPPEPAGHPDDAIAVIGLSCRFPGARDHREFWHNLREGRGGGTTWSPAELRALGVPDELVTRPGYVPHRSVVDGRAEFDPAFFGISPRDAELMDPQGRLLLQHAWQALEDAGYRPEDVPRTGVVTATSTNFYQALLPTLMDNAAGTRVLASAEAYTAWLLAQGGSVPTMISSKLGLRGPSMSVSTNCSSALSGVYLACQELLTGGIDVALAGAASLCSAADLGYVHQPGLNFAGDGRSKAFADGADGMAGGEGVGVVVLKRARDAVADGDHVYCLIRGIAVNNDGGDKAGFYAPSVRGQAEVIGTALARSGVAPDSIRYVEAHGTGTRLGDPIEVAALTEAYRRHTGRSGYCGIGSVKSNIGHLDAAAGIAGLIKLALALHHGEVPRTLHCDVPNSEIDWDSTPFFVADRNIPLGRDGDRDGTEPPRAGLSSFGIGGTNVHAVLEQAGCPAPAPRPGPQLVVLSARDEDRLDALARELHLFLPDYRGDLASLAYTLQVGRRAMARRVAFLAGDLDELAAQVGAYVDHRAPDAAFEGTARGGEDELVGLFARTGQLRDLVGDWLERGEWDKVAPLWVSGVDVDWRRCHGPNPPPRVSLPAYPFDPKEFWPTPAAPAPRPAPPADAGALLAATAGTDGVERFLARHAQTAAGLDLVLRRLVLAQLVALGLFAEPVRHDRVGSGVIATGYRSWLDHSVRVLAEGGELVCDGDLRAPAAGAPDLERAWRAWHEWRDAHAGDPELAAKATLAERMLEAMPGILTGESAATAAMFPDGSFELVEPVYRRNATADYFNAVTADAVRAEVARLRGEPRILEIGAGTGATSERVFEQLAGHAVAEYCYTDISKAFLIAAQERFGSRVPCLTCRTFDVERDPVAQGLPAGHYDIVVANNVLHATEDIVVSVRHACALLRPGGVLVLNELAENGWWSHLTFGLLPGWWRPADGRRLDGGPALSPESWREVLRENGFEAVRLLAERARPLGQQVVLARLAAAPAGADVQGTIERILMASLKLREEELAVDQPFADYGLDSLTGVNLVRMLNESLGTDLDPSVLFEHPSIRRLTAFIVESGVGSGIASRVESGVASNVESSAPPPATAEPREPIAVIGMSGRFPGARDVDEFWDLLVTGRDPVTPVSRWDHRGSQCPDGGFLDGIDEFDPLFFGISGTEATYMEPQQRLFLQEAWKALEDAGHAGESLDRDRCGIYVGCAAGDYLDLTTPSDYPAQAFWGNMNSLVPSRIAYYLDLHGPALAVDTACSSSLVSVYLACQGLWVREADLAIAGGVYVQNSPRLYLAGSRAGMLSPTGRCRSFDEAADGFVPAEGVGALVLKRLSDAEADGDHVHGVIRGIGTNQDGTTNGITAPNGNAQERLIRQVYEDFGIDPETLGLVEAHGTGTRLGDPVEFRALERAFRAFTARERFCSLGSSKASIGHAQAAAGVIGIIKTLLAIRHGTVPGLQHHRRTNPGITVDGSPFHLHTEPREWVAPPGGRRRAAVTSLGASGTNAHAVIEEPPPPPRPATPGAPRLVALSAPTERALGQQVTRLARHCREHPDLDLAAVSYTLLMGRTHFRHRWAAVVHDVAELERELSGGSGGRERGAGRVFVLAAEYLDGATPDFGELFRDGRHRRVPLPTYPFERERYALPRAEAPRNDVLTGEEFYLRDHRVRGTAIAPGAMYLQWAHAAAARPGSVVSLRDIVFLRPLDVSDGPRALRVTVAANRFEVLSGDEPVVHCQGGLSYTEPAAPRVLDLPAMRRDFTGAETDPERFYADYRARGIDYGPALRGCVALRQAADGAVLAELALPDAVAGTAGEFALHPTLVDSAMQCMRLLADDGQDEVGLVFSIREAEVLAPCPSRVWAWVRRAGDPRGTDRIDIDLADEHGTVCLALRGIMGRRTKVGTGVGAGAAAGGAAGAVAGGAAGGVTGAAAEGPAGPAAEVAAEGVAGPAAGVAAEVGTGVGAGAAAGGAAGAVAGGAAGGVTGAAAEGPAGPAAEVAAEGGTGAAAGAAAGTAAEGAAGAAAEGVAGPAAGVAAEGGTGVGARAAAEGAAGTVAENTAVPEPPALTLRPVWDPDHSPRIETWSSESVGILAASPVARDLLLARYPSAHVLDTGEAVRAAPALDHLIWVAPECRETADHIIEDQSAGTLQVFRTVKALLAAGYGDRPLGWTLVTHRAHAADESEPIDPTHAGVAGLAGSMAKEYPNWRVRVADVDTYDPATFAAVLELPADPDGNPRLRRDGAWFRQQLLTVPPHPPAGSRLREGGTYVVVGGAGGLGTVISEYLIRRYRARVVWLGRSPLDTRVEAALATAAGSGGPAPLYLRADATSAESLRGARAEIERRVGPVHGIIHSGLVLAGASLAKMTEPQFGDVLRGKVDASVRLMEVFGGESLDVAVFLSSINSYLKAIKQANYAAACTFLDSFALTVRRRHGCAARVLNLGYCFNNALPGVPLVQPGELTAGIERLCSGTATQLTLMKFGPALNTRGITVGDGDVREVVDDLERLRARTGALTALAI